MTRLLLQGYPFCTTTSTLFLVASSIAATEPAIAPACHKHLGELQYAAALNSVTWCQTRLGTVQFNNWSPPIALQTRLRRVEISFLSYSRDFFSSLLPVTEQPSAVTQSSSSSKGISKWYSTTYSRALCLILRLLFEHLQSYRKQQLPKVPSGRTLLECNSSLCGRPVHNLFSGAMSHEVVC